MALGACHKSFLSVPPQGFNTLDAYYTSTGVNQLLIGWTEFEVIGDRLAVRITDQA